MKPIYYGLINVQQAVDTACYVARIIPGGNVKNTFHQLLETCAVETQLGHYKDPTPNGAGNGLPQIDPDTFDWLKTKYRDSKQALAILDQTGIDIDLVSFEELNYNPLLAMIWCRLRYCAVPLPIPGTQEERAKYWKLYYNTVAGKGTAEHYMKAVARLYEINLESPVWDQ